MQTAKRYDTASTTSYGIVQIVVDPSSDASIQIDVGTSDDCYANDDDQEAEHDCCDCGGYLEQDNDGCEAKDDGVFSIGVVIRLTT
jgi:hypothetical protein